MIKPNDYKLLDRPEVLRVLFYPRPHWPLPLNHRNARSLMIPVSPGVEVEVQAYLISPEAPNLIFFHGNGEIASDYEEIAPFYTGRGINFLVCDYRGYGRSGGVPTVSAMMEDCLEIFHYLRRWLREASYSGIKVIMGRSLGSAPALEIAYRLQEEIDGVIIESGFAYIGPLLRLLGVDMEKLGIEEEHCIGNLVKIGEIWKTTLIIHAQYDHIIAFQEGEALFKASPAREKRLLRIPGANHNNIFLAGMTEYMAAIEWLVDVAGRARPE